MLRIGLILFIGAASSFALDLHFGQYGESSFQLLKIHSNPRTIALSGSGTALGGNALEASDQNPASAYEDSNSLYLGNYYSFKEFEAMIPNFTWNLSLWGHKLFIHSRYLGFDDIQGYDEQGDTLQDYGAHTLKGQLGLAGKYKFIQWGISTGYVQHNIAFANYFSFILDVGIRFNPFNNFWVGAAINNGDIWSGALTFDKNKSAIPPTIARLGISYAVFLPRQFKTILIADARTRNDEKLTFPMGIEVDWRGLVDFWFGFPIGEPEPGISSGLGLNWKGFQFRYGVQMHETLSFASAFNLRVGF